MPTSPTLILIICILCVLVCAADDFHLIPVHRHEADADTVKALSAIRKRQNASLPSTLGQSLYWFAQFSVGDAPDLSLLIDTGSSDLVLNSGVYKPSNHSKPYGSGTFVSKLEGINRDGFGFIETNGTTYSDFVTVGNLTVPDQVLGSATSYEYFDGPQRPSAFPNQGIIGFIGAFGSIFHPRARPWIFNLCRSKTILDCRFGLALGTSGKGQMVIGALAQNFIKGELLVLPRIRRPSRSYTVLGDVTINNTIVVKNQTIVMDVGTDNIQAPIDVTKHIFDVLGYQTHIHIEKDTPLPHGLDVTIVKAYFECNKPPTLGFSLPAQSQLKAGEKATIFNVSPLVWNVYDHGNNNCTSILGGTNAFTELESVRVDPHLGPFWLLGQPFFAGRYIDFNLHHLNTIGFGDLKDPSMVRST